MAFADTVLTVSRFFRLPLDETITNIRIFLRDQSEFKLAGGGGGCSVVEEKMGVPKFFRGVGGES